MGECLQLVITNIILDVWAAGVVRDILINILKLLISGLIQSILSMLSPLLSSHLFLKVTFSCPVIENFI